MPFFWRPQIASPRRASKGKSDHNSARCFLLGGFRNLWKLRKRPSWDIISIIFYIKSGPSPGFSSRGGQKPERGAKNQKATFLKYSVGCMQQPVGQTWNGGHRFQMGGRAPLAPPLAKTLHQVRKRKQHWSKLFSSGKRGLGGHQGAHVAREHCHTAIFAFYVRRRRCKTPEFLQDTRIFSW